MALHWDVNEVKDNDTICFVVDGEDENGKPLRKLNHRTEGLIFLTMGVGIGKITEDNAAEFYARARIMENTNGAMCYGSDPVPALADKLAKLAGFSQHGPKRDEIATMLREAGVGARQTRDEPFTMEEIRNHIGLYTNVSFETREEWARRHFIGKGDHLKDYGTKAMTDEEIEREEKQLEKRVEDLYEQGDYKEADKLNDRLDRIDVSMTQTLVRQYRSEQKATA